MSTTSSVWAAALWLLFLTTAIPICGVWLLERKHTYLAFIGLAPIAFAFAMLVDLAPIDAPYRIAISAAFLLAGAYLGLEGLTRRTGVGPGPYAVEATAGLGVMAVFALAATHQSLVWELRVQDYTAVIMISISFFSRARFLNNGRNGDRLIGLEILPVVVYFALRSWIGLNVSVLPNTRWAFDVFTPPFVIGFGTLGALIAGTITVQELATVIATLQRERDTDMLTEVLNRRGFQARVEHLLNASHHVPSCLVVCDVDNFKSVNDRYGHLAGDEVLRRLGVLLRAPALTSNVLGRIGGDEFAVYLTGSTQCEAEGFAERIRHGLSHGQLQTVPAAGSITASFGIATTVAGMEFSDLLGAADERLYQAKQKQQRKAAPVVPQSEPA
jgi:diguanylate cyclase (GGDEF)-like protein